jgi:MoaA/NifB/PqqE/SkfB family radical SAM enzyme
MITKEASAQSVFEMNLTKKLPTPIRGLDFSLEEVRQTAFRGGLLRISLEICNNRCPLSCIYCYSHAGTAISGGPSDDLIQAMFIDAQKMGAKTAVLTGGGEPFVDPDRLFRIIDFAERVGLWIVIWTNGVLLNQQMVKKLKSRSVSIITKVNSMPDSPEVTDWLSGKQGAHTKMWAAIEMLLDSGYNTTTPTRLGIESVIVPKNVSEIPLLWRFCREHNIFPYFEGVKILGRAEYHEAKLKCNPTVMRQLFINLHDIDSSVYGFDWPLLSPVPGFRCTQIFCGCYITARGRVRPCPGLFHHVGLIKFEGSHTNLRQLLTNPPFPELRRIKERLKEPCRSCHADPDGLCYGCRASACDTNGLFGLDHECWYVAKVLDNSLNRER